MIKNYLWSSSGHWIRGSSLFFFLSLHRASALYTHPSFTRTWLGFLYMCASWEIPFILYSVRTRQFDKFNERKALYSREKGWFSSFSVDSFQLLNMFHTSKRLSFRLLGLSNSYIFNFIHVGTFFSHKTKERKKKRKKAVTKISCVFCNLLLWVCFYYALNEAI